jgi:hypothetical protein
VGSAKSIFNVPIWLLFKATAPRMELEAYSYAFVAPSTLETAHEERVSWMKYPIDHVKEYPRIGGIQ